MSAEVSTPRPWRVERRQHWATLRGPGPTDVIATDVRKADAELIVAAVNAAAGADLSVEQLLPAVEYAFGAAREWEPDPVHSFMNQAVWPYERFAAAVLDYLAGRVPRE